MLGDSRKAGWRDAGSAGARGLRRSGVMATVDLEHEDEQAGRLISGALQDGRDLAVAAGDKIKAEAITQVRSAGEGAKYGGAGVLLLAMAVMMLGVAIASGLAAAGLAWWLALGLVAIAFGASGMGLLRLATERRRRTVNGPTLS